MSRKITIEKRSRNWNREDSKMILTLDDDLYCCLHDTLSGYMDADIHPDGQYAFVENAIHEVLMAVMEIPIEKIREIKKAVKKRRKELEWGDKD